MNITKLGHSCLLVEENGAKIMIDPGAWSIGHTEVENLDAIFITHKHQDHADPESIKKILEKNPSTPIYSNDHVIEELGNFGIKVERFIHGEKKDVKGVSVEAYGEDHATIYPTFPRTDNTCYLVVGRLFHTGDSFYDPGIDIEILALPVVAPWVAIAECIDYAKKVKPKVSFPIHDGMLKHIGPFHKLPEMMLEPEGINWTVLENGVTKEF